MIELELENISYCQIDSESIYLLRERKGQSQLIKLNHLRKEEWIKNLNLSYACLKFGDHLYVTEKNAPQKTANILASDGEIVEISDSRILHIPPLFIDDKYMVTYATNNGDDTFLILNKSGDILRKFNPNTLDKAKVLDSNGYITLINNELTLYDFSSGEKLWSRDFTSLIDLKDNDGIERLSLRQSFNFEDLIILSIADNNNNNKRFLICIQKSSGKLNWILNDLHYVGTDASHIYGISRKETIFKIDSKSGEIIRENNLSRDGLRITNGISFQEEYLIFKDESKGKLGLINPESLEILGSIQLPRGYQFGQYKFPYIYKGKAYCHSPMNKKFCIINF